MSGEAAEDDSSPPPPPPELFHLDLHAWIETQQTSHGVRHDDYAQYHGYCTRRLSRLSHLPDAKKYLVASAKYATVKPTPGQGGGGGGRHAFCSRHKDTLSVDNDDGVGVVVVPHVNVLWYLLVLSERSWAHANQLSRDKKRRQQVLQKLKRATQWANRLLQKAQVSCDASTIQECQAYASWMAANYALEQLDYGVSTLSCTIHSTQLYHLGTKCSVATEQLSRCTCECVRIEILFTDFCCFFSLPSLSVLSFLLQIRTP